MQALILVVHVLTAIMLIVLVLLQHGKGADAGASFGAGASSTVFGSQGSTSFLMRMTALLAFVFFATSLSLAYLAAHQKPASSLLDSIGQHSSKTMTSSPASGSVTTPGETTGTAPSSSVPLPPVLTAQSSSTEASSTQTSPRKTANAAVANDSEVSKSATTVTSTKRQHESK